MSKATHVSRQLVLALRGPITTLKEYTLPKYVYNQAAQIGLLQFSLGGTASTAAKSALDSLVTAAATQELPRAYDNDCGKMGPWQAFAAITMENKKYCSMICRKHPSIKDCEKIIEETGLINLENGCASIAGYYDDVKHLKSEEDYHSFLKQGGKMVGLIKLALRDGYLHFSHHVAEGYIMPYIVACCGQEVGCG